MTTRLTVLGATEGRRNLPALSLEERPALSIRTVAVVPATDDGRVWESAMTFAVSVAEGAKRRRKATAHLVITVGEVHLDEPWTGLSLGAPSAIGDVNEWALDFDERRASTVAHVGRRAELLVSVGAEMALRARPWLTVLVTRDAPLLRWTRGARQLRDAVDVALADARSEYGQLLGALAATT